MLCPADATLVRRDPDLPGLEGLLDADRFAASLAALYPRGGVRGAEASYVRYKPGTSCLVGYRVDTEAGPVDVYARAHGPRVAEKIDKAAGRESVPSPLGGGIKVLAKAGIVVYPFPNDHELAALRRLEDPARRRPMLERLLADRPDLWESPLEPLRYKPERRFVARLGEGAVLKFYTKQDYLLRKDNVDTFSCVPPLRVPRRLGRLRRCHVVALEWLEGASLAELLPAADAPEALGGAVGAALARLHAQKPGKLTTVWTADAYARLLTDGAAAVGEIAPDLAERARRLARRVGGKLASRHWRARRAIHGDCSADQVLLGADTVAVVDFDRAGFGDPRIDLGNFQARLAYDVLLGRLDGRRAEACFEGLLEAYRASSMKDVTRKLARHTAASLLQCAVEPFRHRHREWPRLAEAVLAEAERFAGDGTAS